MPHADDNNTVPPASSAGERGGHSGRKEGAASLEGQDASPVTETFSPQPSPIPGPAGADDGAAAPAQGANEASGPEDGASPAPGAAGASEPGPGEVRGAEAAASQGDPSEGEAQGEAGPGPDGRVRFYERLGLTRQGIRRGLLVGAAVVVLVMGLLALVWSREPKPFDVGKHALEVAQARGLPVDRPLPEGFVTVATVIRLGRTLLDKGGGFLANDIMPPSVLMDDMPSWEKGVLKQIQICLQTLLASASGSQGAGPDQAVVAARKAFSTDPTSWWFPAAETSYREGLAHLEDYLDRLAGGRPDGARFQAQSVALVMWLNQVEESLNDLSRQLTASVGPESRVGRSPEVPATGETSSSLQPRTPWIRIDDVFYQARGTGWALTHLMAAVAVDFEAPLGKAHGFDALSSIRRDLEGTQKPISSPVVLNGAEFGVFANHSLVMSAYLSRAETGIIALRSRLQ